MRNQINQTSDENNFLSSLCQWEVNQIVNNNASKFRYVTRQNQKSLKWMGQTFNMEGALKKEQAKNTSNYMACDLVTKGLTVIAKRNEQKKAKDAKGYKKFTNRIVKNIDQVSRPIAKNSIFKGKLGTYVRNKVLWDKYKKKYPNADQQELLEGFKRFVEKYEKEQETLTFPIELNRISGANLSLKEYLVCDDFSKIIFEKNFIEKIDLKNMNNINMDDIIDIRLGSSGENFKKYFKSYPNEEKNQNNFISLICPKDQIDFKSTIINS